MEKWLDRVGIFLLVVFGLLYVGAKIHFFTRYFLLGPGAYVEEHWPFWAGMAVVGAVATCLGWIRNRLKRSKSN
jgi:hypothetical protein